MRQIVLDTETTGLSAQHGHRIIEIGCVELVHRRLTGKVFHTYLQPERKVDEGAIRVHGLTNEFLQNMPLFKNIVDGFKQFIQGAELIIHNAPFDVSFIENEFLLLKDRKWQKLDNHCKIFDTLPFARQKHPGQRNNLDALCKRYNIDNQHREKHGALLDAEILAEVYLAMTGGQDILTWEEGPILPINSMINTSDEITSKYITQTAFIAANEQELRAHEAFLDLLEKAGAKAIWRNNESG